MNRVRLYGSLAVFALLALALTGCKGKVTGGGTIQSLICHQKPGMAPASDPRICLVPGPTAHFGFNAQSCTQTSGQFQYNDMGAANYCIRGDHSIDVKFHGHVRKVASCLPANLGDAANVERQRDGVDMCFDCAKLFIRTWGAAAYDGDGNSLSFHAVKLSYRSTNPAIPGYGRATACLFDLGEGTAPHGYGAVKVWSGPYRNYFNVGPVQGNVQGHQCPAAPAP